MAAQRQSMHQATASVTVPAEHSTLVQSRETGDVIPEQSPTPRGQVKALPFAKSWVHFMAGG